MDEILRISIIVLISVFINFLSFYYLTNKYKNIKVKKEEKSKIKNLTSYSVSILALVIVVVVAYTINISAMEFTNLSLIVILNIIAYLTVIIFSFVYSNMVVDYIKYLVINKEKNKEFLVFVIHNIITLSLTYSSLYTFILLTDYKITSILRLLMLLSFILSFTAIILYKDTIEYLKDKKS